MRGHHERARACPVCPACGSAHYPATTGAGSRVWCDGSPADPHAEIERARRAEQAREFRRALLAERAERDERPPIEPWESNRIPRGI